MVVLFYFNASQRQRLGQVGGRLRCFGEVRRYAKGWQMVHPEYQCLAHGHAPPLEERLTPIYATTEGVSQNVLRQSIVQALAWAKSHAHGMDVVPAAFASRHQLPDLVTVLHTLHQPSLDDDVEALLGGQSVSHKRLVIEELASHQIGLLKIRREAQQYRVKRYPRVHGYTERFM